MANLYEKFNRVAEAEQTYEKVVEQNPKDVKACGALAAFYNKPLWDEQGQVWVEGTSKGARRAKFSSAIATLARCADIDTADPSGHYKLAMFYWDKAYRDPLLGDKEKNAYADKGIEAVNNLARDQARLLGGDHHQGPALPREGPGGPERGGAQAVPRPGASCCRSRRSTSARRRRRPPARARAPTSRRRRRRRPRPRSRPRRPSPAKGAFPVGEAPFSVCERADAG